MVSGRLFLTRLPRQLSQVGRIALPVDLAPNRAQGSVGFQVGGIQTDFVALQKPLFLEHLQNLFKHLLVDLQRKPPADARKARVIRGFLQNPVSQKTLQTLRIRSLPGDPPLGASPFKIAHHEHPKVHPRRNRRPPQVIDIVGIAQLLAEGAERGPSQGSLPASSRRDDPVLGTPSKAIQRGSVPFIWLLLPIDSDCLLPRL